MPLKTAHIFDLTVSAGRESGLSSAVHCSGPQEAALKGLGQAGGLMWGMGSCPSSRDWWQNSLPRSCGTLGTLLL